VNRQLNRLALVAIGLLAVLVVATTYWQTWASAGLQDRQDNAIQRVVQFTVARGLIYGAGGKKVFAANKRLKRGNETFYFRRYPQHKLAAQTIGYSTASRSQSGLERSMNDYLTGANTNLSEAFRSILSRLGPATVHGSNLQLTIRPGAQRLAEGLLGSRCGSVVAMNPHTGAVDVMASTPTYDLNLINQPDGYAKVLKIRGACGGASALYNRATQGLFVPGSTFKVITAAAALDTGTFTPDSSFYDPGYCTEYGVQVHNALDQNGPEQFGNVNLIEAYIHSINAVFCDLGIKLGAKTILDKAKQFGFYSAPPIELPPSEVAASGLYDFKKHRLFDNPSLVDPGRMAFGQERMLVTPLQMALVAAGVANNGKVMVPHLVNKVTNSGGGTVVKVHPQVWKTAMKPSTAAAINQMMQGVVQSGTGTAAQIPGVKVAGKTGTAETGARNVYTAWFIFFAPADNPQVAGAIAVEHQLNGFGGAIAAPIAKQLMQAILAPASKH
jgi:peptidoglycan glycosyltransferase